MMLMFVDSYVHLRLCFLLISTECFLVWFDENRGRFRHYIGDEDLKCTASLEGYSRLETFDLKQMIGKHTKSG